MNNVTPMLRQYLDIKKQYPGTILFFRLGDFYEMFNEDAVTGSRELGITLTARQKDSANPIPMCGVPHHAAAGYIARLVGKGYRVAICEQTEVPSKDTKLVRREVVKVITPGTAIDAQLIDSKTPVYFAAVSATGDNFGLAFIDLSNGDFASTEISGRDSWTKVVETIAAFDPNEFLFPPALQHLVTESFGDTSINSQPILDGGTESTDLLISGHYTPLADDYFDLSRSLQTLKDQFGVRELTAFGMDEKPESVRAAGACLHYIGETQKNTAGHVTEIRYFEASDCLILDSVTLRNLEIFDSRSGDKRQTLFGILDETVTGMGSRLLRSWLTRPSLKRTEIQTRLTAVNELQDSILRQSLRNLMKEVADLDRLAGKVNLGTSTARDILALSRSLRLVPQIENALSDADSLLLQVLAENIFHLPEICELIDSSIADDPPANLNDGGTIRDGFDTELDELRGVSRSGKQTIAAFEENERKRTGIGNLKVRFNGVFGYYIEVSKSNLGNVPADYERKQTLANGERYTTPELKEWEQKVFGADEQIMKIELRLFHETIGIIAERTKEIQSTARALATLDALSSLAEVASRNDYVSPLLHDGDAIEIKNGRHPVVEVSIKGQFIPNDIYLNNSSDRLLVVTGANMGGKSTILRQVALIQVMAQIGSFVPASAAKIPIVDRIWTRVGASDDLASGRSTFMVEMTETAAILHNATPRSLILLDEIGRGTSTFDGLSIAWAVAEYVHNSSEHSAKTMFATHYHEMTELAENLPGAKNYQITATEKDDSIVFLHKLKKGKASKSYGIAVARLAGLPISVIERAKAVLQKLEKYELAVFADGKQDVFEKASARAAAAQVSLFAITNETIVNEIRISNIESLSPADAKRMLEDIKARIV